MYTPIEVESEILNQAERGNFTSLRGLLVCGVPLPVSKYYTTKCKCCTFLRRKGSCALHLVPSRKECCIVRSVPSKRVVVNCLNTVHGALFFIKRNAVHIVLFLAQKNAVYIKQYQ